MSDSNSAAHGEHIGMVKWFNYKLGYGFITVTIDGEENDIFIHQSNIKPTLVSIEPKSWRICFSRY